MRDRGAESGACSLATFPWHGTVTLPSTDANGARTLRLRRLSLGQRRRGGGRRRFRGSVRTQPEGVAGRRGMGSAFANVTDAAPRSWNADVYTSWGFAKKVSLYGRLGFVQSEPVASSSRNRRHPPMSDAIATASTMASDCAMT